MLFQTRFHAGIRSGTVTRTFRTWASPRAKPGARHRFPGGGFLLIRSVEAVAPDRLRPADARAAGFEDVDSLLEALGEPRPGTR